MKLTVVVVNIITPISALISMCKMVKGIFTHLPDLTQDDRQLQSKGEEDVNRKGGGVGEMGKQKIKLIHTNVNMLLPNLLRRGSLDRYYE